MQLAMHMVTIEDLMPQGHFLRKLEAALDLSVLSSAAAPEAEETDVLALPPKKVVRQKPGIRQ